MQRRNVAAQELERAVREHDAEPERRGARILLDHSHLRVRPPPLGKQSEEQSGGAGAGDADAHGLAGKGRGLRRGRDCR